MHHSHTSPLDGSYVIQRARDEDAPALARLAALDSARPLAGEVLVAYVGGAPWAALALHDGRVVADPFRPSAHAVELLRLRAAHLARPGRAARPRRHPLRALRRRAVRALRA